MEGLSQNEKTIWTCWEAKTNREVVREAATKGNLIKLAHSYLMHKNSWTEEETRDWFQSEVFVWVYQLLERKQIHKARHTLEKTKIVPEQHFLKIASEAKEIQFRDYLVEQLKKSSDKLNQDEWLSFIKHWNLLRYLEKSFEIEGTFKQNKAFGKGKTVIVVTESEIKDLNIVMISNYSAEWKSKIAAHLFFDTFEFSLLEFITPLAMWSHLIEQNKAMVLIRWINMHMSEVVRDMNARYTFFTNDNFVQRLQKVDTKGLTKEILEKLDEYFRIWPIDEEMISIVSNKHCFAYTKMCIYDTLSSYGIIIEEERKNLQTIVSRLARTRNLRMVDVVFAESCATMNKSEFYMELAKYCLNNKLYNAFTCCVDCGVFDKSLTDVDEDIKGCIELWLLFKSIEQTSDRQSHVLPIYKTCEQIAKNNIAIYICQNPFLVLGMILMDENKSLFDIFTDNNILKFNEFELPLRCSFDDRLSHLKNVWNAYTNDTIAVENDVNVYQLLSGYRGLDVSKIFEFQLINHKPVSGSLSEKTDRRSLGSLISSEFISSTAITKKPQEMPHFANEALMKKYGYVARLNHIYYLKQCRPCTASKAFVTDQYLRYNRLHEKGIKSGCSEAHAIGLQNWNDATLSASAISFITMIGCNPTRCRIHISAAKMIKEYLINVENKSQEAAVVLVNDMLSRLSQNEKETALDMLSLLETITMHNIYNENKEKEPQMPFIIYEWQTAIKFAMLHCLPLPESQPREFVKFNLWFPFLLFGDVFRYPQQQMLELSRGFKCRSYAEHLKHIIIHRSLDDVSFSDKESAKQVKDFREKRASRLSSTEVSPTHNMSFEFPDVLSSCDDLWEVLTLCHTQEDPPSALLNAALSMHAPILALVATCYEPDAAGVCWAYWLISILDDKVPHILEDIDLDVSDKHPSEEQIYFLCGVCIKAGYVRTLHESMLIFFPESPLTTFTAFLCKTVWQLSFDSDATKLIYAFHQCCLRKNSTIVESVAKPIFTRKCLQKISVGVVQIVIEKGFSSAFHLKEFLKCLVDSQFGKDFSVPTSDYVMFKMLIDISMETTLKLDFESILDGELREDYFRRCIDTLIKDSQYELALSFAKTSRLPSDDILTAEWLFKWEQLVEESDGFVDEKERTFYLASCSEAFKMASVTFKTATKFLLQHVDNISDLTQKFYAYRLVLSWFDDGNIYDQSREDIEHKMWQCYFSIDNTDDIFHGSYLSTVNFVLNKQKEYEEKTNDDLNEVHYDKLLAEIETQSCVENIDTVEELNGNAVVEKWRKILTTLLEKGLTEEAFRLSKLFKAGEDGNSRNACPCLLVTTCMKLAEGKMSPYDIPHELKLVISSPLRRSRLSGSETSVASFEELVIISDKPDESVEASTSKEANAILAGKESCKPNAQLAGREEADRLSALECLASRSGISLAKQVASYYRISLQIGWPYAQLLKYRGNPLDFISYVSGRVRMGLANLVFRTYNIPSKQIADYLCQELVAALISPHLIKTSTFRQKEHFQYTLWGYPLNSDMEMFLNLRPNACSLIGRAVLDHLMAFGRIYRSNLTSRTEIDENSLDVETLLDEEYQTVEHSELDSVTTTTGESVQTVSSVDSGSLYSDATTVYSFASKMNKESRRNLFDVISKCNVHIPFEVKSNVRKITKGAKLTSKQVNIISIELLVIAHDAFSSACDTEGIAVVLRSAQALSTRLLQAKSWRLLARLLTGLARYTEMAYVFQMLMDNDQFEFLLGQVDYMLGQQQDKIAEFKQGLLDYLKTHRPADTETYCMVAHHFNMYCEAADVKNKQAEDLIASLGKMATNDGQELPFNNTAILLLETSIQHYTDASEWYLRGGALGAARLGAGGAMRAALQIALLQRASSQSGAQMSRAPFLFASDTVSSSLFGRLGVLEGLVLCQALEGHMSSWRELAYGRLQNNDLEYAKSLASLRPDLAVTLLQRHDELEKKDLATNTAFRELKALVK